MWVESTHIYVPKKMEQTECSETSAYKLQTPGYYPKESIKQRFPLCALHFCGLDNKEKDRKLLSGVVDVTKNVTILTYSLSFMVMISFLHSHWSCTIIWCSATAYVLQQAISLNTRLQNSVSRNKFSTLYKVYRLSCLTLFLAFHVGCTQQPGYQL